MIKKNLVVLILVSFSFFAVGKVGAISFDYHYPISNETLDSTNYSVALDTESNLHVVYVVDGQIRYRQNLDNEEIIATGLNPVLSINPLNRQPNIVYEAGGIINFAWRTSENNWQIVTVTNGSSAYLTIDSAGISHLAYLHDNDNDGLNELFYLSGYGYGDTEVFTSEIELADGAYCDNLSCRVTEDFSQPNIVVDDSNNYHVVALGQYRDNTLVPISYDYLHYINNTGSQSGQNRTALSLNLRQHFLQLDNSNQPVAIWGDGSNLKTSTIDPIDRSWSEQNLSLAGTLPSLAILPSKQVLVYNTGDLINYQEANPAWGEISFVATGTSPFIVADDHRYVYYLEGAKLYLAADREVPDNSAPVAVISSKPDSITANTSAQFTIGGTDVLAYKYKIDNGSFSSEFLVEESLNLSNLSLGSHTLMVVGRDGSFNWQTEESATSYPWTIISAPASSGGGGGGGAPTPFATSTEIEGRVLGANTFQFKRILRLGMSGVDVQELQNILQKSGFLKIKKTTKYFGPLTQKALMAWKRKNKIRPYTGVLSRFNLIYLNNLEV